MLTYSKTSGSFLPVGTTQVTATAGSTGQTCSFNVTVTDNTASAISCPGNQILPLNASNCSYPLPDYRSLATVSDNCGTPTVTQSPALGTTLSGTTPITVKLTATDGSENNNFCTFTVTPTCGPCKNATNLTTIHITSNSASLNWMSLANPVQWNVRY